MAFLLGLVSNVLANVVFWLGLGAMVWLVASIARRRFVDFFGLSRDGQITVHLSNLWDPASTAGPAGYTISRHEFQVTQSVSRLFGSASMRLPEMARGLVDGLWLRQIPQPDVAISPVNVSQVSIATSSIIIGGATRNTARALFVDSALPFIGFDTEERSLRRYSGQKAVSRVEIFRGFRAGEKVDSSLNPAIVEKIYDGTRGITLFFCLGARGDTTWAAAEYLVRNWAELRREFGNREFALCLGFPAGTSYLDHYVEPRRLANVTG